MSILAYATGVSQLIYGESSIGGSTSYLGDYVLESFNGADLVSSTDNTLHFSALPDSFWVSFSVHFPSTASLRSDLTVIDIGDGTTSLLTMVYDDDKVFNINWFDGTDTVTIYSMPNSETTGEKIRFDIGVTYGTDGSIEVNTNRDEAITYSLDTTTSGVSCTQATFDGIQQSFNSNDLVTSAFFIADQDTTYITPYQFVLGGDGTIHTDFEGSYTYLNNLGATGDLQSVVATSTGDKQSYVIDGDNFSEVSGGTVVGVGLHTRGKVQEELSYDQFRFLVTDGTDESYSDYKSMNKVISPFQCVFDTAPDGSDWTVTTIANYEIGLEVSESE